MRLFSMFIVFCLALAFCSVVEAGEPRPVPVLVDAGDFDCLPVDHFGLAGLRLWRPESTITGKLGAPLRISKDSGEDDGGRYTVRLYHYPHLLVETVRGQIDRIVTESAAMPMPSGVRVGDSLEEVTRKFGRRPRDIEDEERELQIVTCPVNGNWFQEDYVTLSFDNGWRLVSIAYEANRP